jgi:hypothetical protein
MLLLFTGRASSHQRVDLVKAPGGGAKGWAFTMEYLEVRICVGQSAGVTV